MGARESTPLPFREGDTVRFNGEDEFHSYTGVILSISERSVHIRSTGREFSFTVPHSDVTEIIKRGVAQPKLKVNDIVTVKAKGGNEVGWYAGNWDCVVLGVRAGGVVVLTTDDDDIYIAHKTLSLSDDKLSFRRIGAFEPLNRPPKQGDVLQLLSSGNSRFQESGIWRVHVLQVKSGKMRFRWSDFPDELDEVISITGERGVEILGISL